MDFLIADHCEHTDFLQGAQFSILETTTFTCKVLHTPSIRQYSNFFTDPFLGIKFAFTADSSNTFVAEYPHNTRQLYWLSFEQTNLRLSSACLRSDPTGLYSDHNFSFFWSYFQEPNSQFQLSSEGF